MTDPTHERLTKVFRDVFGDDELAIAETTTARDIEDWDSLLHVTLIVSVEQEFGIKMSASEVGELNSVGDLLAVCRERAEK